MTGGLIQLITTGIQDSPLIGNPEITFFKTVYRQHTVFSLCQNTRTLGKLETNKEGVKVLEKNGDLLYNMYFKLEIPYFDIIKKVVSTNPNPNKYVVNQLDVTYRNTNCIVLLLDEQWYIVPENLFGLSAFDNILSQVNINDLYENLLPDVITITDLGSDVQLYEMVDHPDSPLISILRVNSSFWEQYWLDFLSNATSVIYNNKLITFKSENYMLNTLLSTQIYNSYYNNIFIAKNSAYFNFNMYIQDINKNYIYDSSGNIKMVFETQRYFDYINNNKIQDLYDSFDIDVTKTYCDDNFLDFDKYKDNCIQNNSLLISTMLQLLFADPTLMFTFWKKYTVTTDNNINNNILINETNFQTEWHQNLNDIMIKLFDTNNLSNLLYEELVSAYSIAEERIKKIFLNLSLVDPTDIYIRLKTILSRYTNVPNKMVNFNNSFLVTKYDDGDTYVSNYNADTYITAYNAQVDLYPLLESNSSTLNANEMNNLTPINLENIYILITNDLVELMFNLDTMSLGLKSFLILWRNTITNRLYRKFLDFYNKTLINNGLINITKRELTLYYSISPSNMFLYDDYLGSLYSLYYRNSWLGTININHNNFLKLKENINIVKINNVNIANNNINFASNVKNFNKLNISNTYTYTYPQAPDNLGKIALNKIMYNDNILYIKYDNYYDKNSSIEVIINNNNYLYNSISYVITMNELNFDSLYLTFDYNNINGVSEMFSSGIPITIVLKVNYESYLPAITFYNNSHYNNIKSNIYTILNKNAANEFEVNNIVDTSNIFIDNNIDLSNQFVLTINYYDNNKIVSPSITFKEDADIYLNTFGIISLGPKTSNNVVTMGKHLYCLSFYTVDGESEVSNIISIDVPQDNIVFIKYPYCNNNFVLGAKIYRTKANDTTFYLLDKFSPATIKNVYIDNISDDMLGIAYDINNNIEINNLPYSNYTTIKTNVKLYINDNMYKITNMNGSNYEFPVSYDNIKNIMLEEYIDIYMILDQTKFTIINSKVTLTNFISDYDNDYLYYFVNSMNFKDNSKLVLSSKSALIDNINTLSIILVDDTTPEIQTIPGTYKYFFTLYNSNTNIESLPSAIKSIYVELGKAVQISGFPNIYDSTYNSWNVYRTPINSDTYYFLSAVDVIDSIITDPVNSYDITTNNLYIQPTFTIISPLVSNITEYVILKVPHNIMTLDTPIDIFTIINSNNAGNITPGNHNYIQTYYNSLIGTESQPSNMVNYFCYTSNQLNVSLISPRINMERKLYKTKIGDSNTYYLVATFGSNTTDISYVDNIKDNDLTVLYIKPAKNIVPNMNAFISHSTDINYMNTKNISDLNDYMFNKPFIMMVNNTNNDNYTSEYDLLNSFTLGNIYFYNIEFKLNSTSIITLNGLNVNYILPISTQQFYIKSFEETYWTPDIINNVSKPVNIFEISQFTFNPSYDEFNLTNIFLNKNYYSDVMIDMMVGKINTLKVTNSDYVTIVTALEAANTEYFSMFTKLLDITNTNIYGSTSLKILNSIDALNNINDLRDVGMVNYPIMNFDNNFSTGQFIYSNVDFISSSHYTLRLVDDNFYKSDIKAIHFNTSNLNILNPVFQYYNASTKLSNNLLEYLYDVSNLFKSHIQYIKDNIDYLTLTNPNSYNEKFLSYQEIQEEIKDNFYNYSGINTMTLLHPIIDDTFYKIILTDEDNNVSIVNTFNINDNIITTTEYNENKIENKYNTTTLLETNRSDYTTNAFNYLGLVNVSDSHEFVFTDEYILDSTSTVTFYKLDDTIYQFTPTSSNRYALKFDITDCMITYPYELTISNNSILQSIIVSYVNSLNYLYKVFINFNDIFELELIDVHFLINDIIIVGSYIPIDMTSGYLYIMNPNVVTFDMYNLLYIENANYNDWHTTPTIISSRIIVFKQVNYTINTSLSDLNIKSGDIFIIPSVDTTYYDASEIIEINNKCYFNINSTDMLVTINLYSKDPSDSLLSSVVYSIKPPLIIKDELVYSHYDDNMYTRILESTKSDNYILLVSLLNDRHFMLKLKDLTNKQIPNDNYHTWLYPSNTLKLIPYNVNIAIDMLGNVFGLSGTIIPTYSYYLMTDNINSCIYYYEDGDNIKIHDNESSYYNMKDTSTNLIYLIDNSLLSTQTPQLISLYGRYNAVEDYISKTVSLELQYPYKISNYNSMVYKSEYSNSEFQVKNFNTNIINGDETFYKINLYGENIVQTNMLLLNSDGSSCFYQPIIFKRVYNEFIIYGCIQFTYNNIEYNRSFIPINSVPQTGGLFDNNNSLISDLVIGTITLVIPSSKPIIKYISVSPNIYINDNIITLKAGFIVSDLNFGLNLWKIQCVTNDNDSCFIYFWTLFTQDTNLISNYLEVPSISEPYYSYDIIDDSIMTISNYLVNNTLIQSYPNIVKQENNNLILNVEITQQVDHFTPHNLNYKYYINNRHRNIDIINHSIMELDYNGIHNIKPIIEYMGKTLASNKNLGIDPTILSNAKFYIFVYNINKNSEEKINILMQSEISKNIMATNITNLEIYFSINYPLFINNKITLVFIKDNKYMITSYDKLFLEMHEIIILDSNYFKVLGLNVNSSSYDLLLIDRSDIFDTITSNNLRYNYSGYYTLGNYLRKDNTIIPELKVQNLATFTSAIGSPNMYLDPNNSRFVIYTGGDVINDIQLCAFQESGVMLSLFYSNNNLYLIDTFIKLKMLDKIIGTDNTVYTINNIRDNIIYLDKPLSSGSSDTFISFVLLYQPFEIMYIEFDDSGNIISTPIDDMKSLVFDDITNSNYMNIVTVINNKIDPTILPLFSAGYKWVRLYDTKYTSMFNNAFHIPDNYDFTQSINTNYAIKINTEYNVDTNRFMINSNISNIIANCYYMQPVKVAGCYNYVKSVIIENNNYYFILLNPTNIMQDASVPIILSPSDCNKTEFFTMTKFRYNYLFNNNNYLIDINTDINVIRYVLLNDVLLSIQTKVNNKMITFKYGVSIIDNEIANNIVTIAPYQSIYFYNNIMIEPNGKVIAPQMTIDSFHLFSVNSVNQSLVYLTKLIYPNKLKFYIDNVNYLPNSSYYLDRLYSIKVNYFGEFVYNAQSIIQSINLLENNMNSIQLIKKYTIKLVGTPQITDKYKQKIQFIDNTIFKDILYNYIYLDEALTQKYLIVFENNMYYIISSQYLGNNITTIYTQLNNFLLSSMMQTATKKVKQLNDTNLDFYIDTKIVNEQWLIQNILVSKINQYKLDYKYMNVNSMNTYPLNSNETYNISKDNQLILNINPNNYTISLYKTLDNDVLESSSDYVNTQLFINNKIDTNIIFDSTILYNNVKQLRIQLYYNSNIPQSTYFNLFNKLKAWKTWAILVSHTKVTLIKQVINAQFVHYIDTDNVEVLANDNDNYSYMTDDDLNVASAFLININKSSTTYDNYVRLKTIIEPVILNNLKNWLDNMDFFLDVTNNINMFLSYYGFDDIIFDGNHINFLNNMGEYSYLTNDYTFDSDMNIVYRSTESESIITGEIANFINKTIPLEINARYFGISIHKLLQYLRELGDKFISLYNNFVEPLSSTPDYDYNNPMKFLINRIWENYSNETALSLLDTTFRTNMKIVLNYTVGSEIISSINYLDNMSVVYVGINSINNFIAATNATNIEYNLNYFTFDNVTYLKPIVVVDTISIDTLFPYIIKFTTNEVIAGAIYTIDINNGNSVTTITDPQITPSQLTFTSSYNIASNDFISIKRQITYNIINTQFLGYSYIIQVDPNINVNIIDTIYYRNDYLTINYIEDIDINILVPFNNPKLEINDVLELRTSAGIISINTIDNNMYISFYNVTFNFNPSIFQTLMKTPNNIYVLQQDDIGYFVVGPPIDNYDVVIINVVSIIQVTMMTYGLYEFTLDNSLNNNYVLIDNNVIVPLDFLLVNDSNTSIIPIGVSNITSNIVRLYIDNNDIINSKSFSSIINTRRLGTDNTNKINIIEGNEEYLYYFSKIIPRTTNTTIYIYDNTNDDIDIMGGVYEPTIDKDNKTSIYINVTDNATYFSVINNYDYNMIQDLSFIQKNMYLIAANDITNNHTTISFKTPNDFTLNVDDKYYYSINTIALDKSTFIYNNGYLTADWNDPTTSGPFEFNQYYIESDIETLQIPLQNKKYKINLDFPYQYNNTNKFYVFPYMPDGKEFGKYLYKLTTRNTTTLTGFGNVKYNDNIIINKNGITYSGPIFDEYYDGMYVNLIFSLNTTIDTTQLNYTYTLSDNIVRKGYGIMLYSMSHNVANYYYQDTMDSVYVFINKEVLDYFECSDPPKASNIPNKFYLISYYNYEVINLFYETKFIQNQSMKELSNNIYTESEIIETPILSDYTKLFAFIRIYFNDMMMEELNEDVFNCHYNLYFTEERRKQFDKLVSIRPGGNGWELYIPLIFWFNNKPGLSIPTVALPYTQLRLRYRTNDITSIITNDLTANYRFSHIPEIRISLNSEFVLLDTIERKLFATHSHEYIIDRYMVHSYNTVNDDMFIIKKNWTGLVKDVYFITKPDNYPGLTYFPKVTNKYDMKFEQYNIALKYYKIFIIDNIYITTEMNSYASDINIISNNMDEFNFDVPTARITNLINHFGTMPIWNDDLLKYLMYFEDKYLYKLVENRKIYVLNMYLTQKYMNTKTVKEISPIATLCMRVNGNDLFAARGSTYYNSVIPYTKFKNSLPTGYYAYSFSLHPTEDQHSGHLNCSNFDDITVIVTSNNTSNYGSYQLASIIKEYNILRVMGGMAGLAWID